VGEELGVLPNMDSILAVGALDRLIRFILGTGNNTKELDGKFDMITYDVISSEKTLRMVGGVERSRCHKLLVLIFH
jgi:hypothetical protein